MDNGTTPRRRRTPPHKAELSKPAVKGQVVSRELQELEATIERGRRAFYETGLALAAIRDSRLY
jgi:hypothetical protein